MGRILENISDAKDLYDLLIAIPHLAFGKIFLGFLILIVGFYFAPFIEGVSRPTPPSRMSSFRKATSRAFFWICFAAYMILFVWGVLHGLFVVALGGDR